MLERAADAFTFLVVGALPSAAVSATIGGTTLSLAGYAPWPRYPIIGTTSSS